MALSGMVVLFIVACGSQSTEPTIAVITPFSSPGPILSVTPRWTSTTELILLLTPSPTPDFTATASVKALMTTVQPKVLETYSSPDEIWKVEIVRYDCINYTYEDYHGTIAYEQIKILSLSTGSEKVIAGQLQACDGIGTYGFGGLYWSPNSRYFYYTDSREGYPETCGNYVALPIYRLDTGIQEAAIIGGGPLSPDGTKIAMWQDHEIIIWDLDDGEVGRTSGLVSSVLNGQISWSPSGQSVAYLQTTWDCAPDYGKTYVTLLTLPNLSQRLLLEYDSPGFGWLSWDTTDRISLKDGMGNMWVYDLVGKELSPSP